MKAVELAKVVEVVELAIVSVCGLSAEIFIPKQPNYESYICGYGSLMDIYPFV